LEKKKGVRGGKEKTTNGVIALKKSGHFWHDIQPRKDWGEKRGGREKEGSGKEGVGCRRDWEKEKRGRVNER